MDLGGRVCLADQYNTFQHKGEEECGRRGINRRLKNLLKGYSKKTGVFL